MSDLVVAKIGGSTLGQHDTTLTDVAALHANGVRVVVVHGGGALISEWLTRLEVPTRFARGLRVTDEATLRVVVAVLAGLVNKELVASLQALGAPAAGLSGADGGMLRCRTAGEGLGFVGEIISVEARGLLRMLDDGVVPVVAPIGVQWDGERPVGQMLNINADTAAGAIAEALGARWLVFLTDVPGVKGADGQVVSRLSAAEAQAQIAAGVIEGGMIPKVEACRRAAGWAGAGIIVDGRAAHALLCAVEGKREGTLVG